MNAPLPEQIRKALDSVTLDDKPRSGLQHNCEACGSATCGGFGVQPARQGGAL